MGSSRTTPTEPIQRAWEEAAQAVRQETSLRALGAHRTSQVALTCSGKKGETKTLREWPECLFQPHAVLLTENAATAEGRVRIQAAYIGTMMQRLPEKFDGVTPLDWQLCQPQQSIKLVIEFLEDASFCATLFGAHRP